jgi:hypothetical protein
VIRQRDKPLGRAHAGFSYEALRQPFMPPGRATAPRAPASPNSSNRSTTESRRLFSRPRRGRRIQGRVMGASSARQLRRRGDHVSVAGVATRNTGGRGLVKPVLCGQWLRQARNDPAGVAADRVDPSVQTEYAPGEAGSLPRPATSMVVVTTSCGAASSHSDRHGSRWSGKRR